MSQSGQTRRFDRPATGRAAIGGGTGGLAGTLLFGVLLWAVSPDVLAESIPGFYGLGTSATVGWGLHLLHGLVLGGTFGIIAARPVVFDPVTGPVATDVLAGLSATARFGLLGLVYGIAIWTLLPFVGLTLLGTLAGLDAAGFSHLAAEMILGHMAFGVIVGAVFSMTVHDRSV